MVCGGGCALRIHAQFSLSPLFPSGNAVMEDWRCASVTLLKTSSSAENTYKYESVPSALAAYQ